MNTQKLTIILRFNFVLTVSFWLGVLILGGYPLSSIAQQSSKSNNHPNRSTSHISFSRDIQPIFDANCVFCHLSGAAQGGLNLESGKAYQSLVLQPSRESKLLQITPGKPEQSYLIRTLEDSHREAGGQGTQMPPLAPLESELIDAIRKWVMEGAVDN